MIDIVFSKWDGSPDLTFVEVESPPGKSIQFGRWVRRDDGFYVLRFPDHQKAAVKWLRERASEDQDYASMLRKHGKSETPANLRWLKEQHNAMCIAAWAAAIGIENGEHLK